MSIEEDVVFHPWFCSGTFEQILVGVYHKRFRSQVLERKIQFYTKLAEEAYKSAGFLIPIAPITAKDFEGYDLNEKSYKWLKAVLPATSIELRTGDLTEISSNKLSNHSKSVLTSSFLHFLNFFIRDMSKGKPTNTPFLLSLERLFFDLIGESSHFIEDDLLGNAKRFAELNINLRNLQESSLPQEEFEGVRYSVNPSVYYDFAELEKEEVVFLGEMLMNYDGVDSVELEGEPIKNGEILSEPTLVLPLSIVDNEFLNKVLKESFNIKREEVQPIKTLVRSIFFKQERWCLYLNGTTLRFLVPKDAVLLKSRDPIRSDIGEHQS